MEFGSIKPHDYDSVRHAGRESNALAQFAAQLTQGLNSLLNSDHPKELWGTSFVSEERVTSGIFYSPFGVARTLVVFGMGSGGIYARYLFEKKVTSDSGLPVYRCVWAVRISRNGTVSTDDGAEIIYEMSSMSSLQRDNGVATVALSALYAIAEDEGHWTPSSHE